jgi:hypothetical protein
LMRRRGQGSASISAVVVFLSALLALGLMATILPPVANVLSGFREGLRERGERGSELIRIYIHSTDETESGRPIITIVNGWDKESILTDYVVVARDGRILTAGKMGGSLSGIRLAPGARIDLAPSDFGLSYPIFAAMADEVKAIYIRTAEGNSFGSSYGPPPSISYDYQVFVSRTTNNIIITGSTSSVYSISISPTLPTLGNGLVVRNVILVDKDGFVRGGVLEGSRWSDGSFDPNAIPNSVAALAQTEIIPIGAYYYVPRFPEDFYCYYSRGVFSVYSGCDTKPWYIEMVEFYPVEIYSPGSPVVATAYYARFPGEVQTVYRDGAPVAVRVQRPLRDWAYPYGVPGSFVTTAAVAYVSYEATVTSTTINRTTTTITSGTITRTRTVTYNTTVITRGTIWQEGGLVKFAPVFAPVIFGDERRLMDLCTIYFGPEGGTKTCSFTIKPPTVDPRSGVFILTYIRSLSYYVSRSYSGTCNLNPKPAIKIENVSISGPWGTLVLNRDWLPSIYYLPVGNVTFTLVASRDPCPGYYSSARLNGGVTYSFIRNEIATATIYSNNFQIDFRRWIQQAIGAGSGDAVVHMAGTVEGGRTMKIRAPIVLLNYIYQIAGGPPTSPPRSGGGGSTVSDVVEICEVNEYDSILPPSSSSSPSTNQPSSSSGSSTGQPLESVSGGTVDDFSVQGYTVRHLRQVFCRPVNLSRPY